MKRTLEALWLLAMNVVFGVVTLIPPLLNPGGYDDVKDWLRAVFGGL